MRRHGLRILVLLLLAAPAAAQPAFAPFHADGIYGDRVGWTAMLPAGATVPAGGCHYVIRRNNADTLKEAALDLSSGAATIETSLDAPGMIAVEITGAQGDKEPQIPQMTQMASYGLRISDLGPAEAGPYVPTGRRG